jgi:hypothetical protein
VQSAALVLGCVNHTFSRISLRYPGSEMNEGPKLEEQRPPRWDSYPLPGKYATPRWDAGVRYWPGGVLLVSVFVLFVVLNVPFGFANGPLLTAAVVASYPMLLILVPIRKRLVPREVATAASRVPLRLWVLGWLLVAAGTALYPLNFQIELTSGNQLVSLVVSLLWFGVIISGVSCVQRAPAWEQWRNRPRKGRKSPQDGNGASTGTVTLGQSN